MRPMIQRMMTPRTLDELRRVVHLALLNFLYDDADVFNHGDSVEINFPDADNRDLHGVVLAVMTSQEEMAYHEFKEARERAEPDAPGRETRPVIRSFRPPQSHEDVMRIIDLALTDAFHGIALVGQQGGRAFSFDDWSHDVPEAATWCAEKLVLMPLREWEDNKFSAMPDQSSDDDD